MPDCLKTVVKIWRLIDRSAKNKKSVMGLYFLSGLFLATLSIPTVFWRQALLDGMGGLSIAELGGFMRLLALNILLTYIGKYGGPFILNACECTLSNALQKNVQMLFYEKVGYVKYPLLENSQNSDAMALAKEGFGGVWNFVKQLGVLSAAAVNFLCYFYLLVRAQASLGALLCAVFLPVALYAVHAGNLFYSVWEKTAALRRHCDYLKGVLLGKEYAQERILYGYAEAFKKLWKEEYGEVRKASIREELKGSVKTQYAGVAFAAYILLFIAVLVTGVRVGRMSLGMGLTLLSVIPFGLKELIDRVARSVGEMTKASHEIGLLSRVLEFEEERRGGAPSQRQAFSRVELKDVRFTYPGAQTATLDRLNLSFETGRHYALVGKNGAGKSTIVKLLLGLYPLQEGCIEVDGRNLSDMTREEIVGVAAMLFQDFEQYHVTLAENIAMGDLSRRGDTEEIWRVADACGLTETIGRLPQSLHTFLGTEREGGIDLSGGEWQKVCLARLMMSRASLKILDEPTASMDPRQELAFYDLFNHLLAKDTTITISHRLNSCKTVDWIYVIDHGRVCEQGSHQDLMRQNGMYAEMFRKQRSQFI